MSGCLRYQMQAVARHILSKNRVGICLRNKVEKYSNVDVFKHQNTQKAFYGGLMVCGLVWICPVCASRISERRRKELKIASDNYLEGGGNLTMSTLTFSHSKFDKLEESLKALGQATFKFRSGRPYDRLRSQLGIEGSIRTFEVTYDLNGWHPHLHILIFHRYEIEDWERERFESQFYELWSAACEKYGFKTSGEHGLKLDDAMEASSYIGKWGDMVEDEDLGYATHFKEYAKAMKGKTQLYWSRGLKQRFKIKERTDEEIAKAKEEPADSLGKLDWEDWYYIIRNDYRAKLLDYVERYGYEGALKKMGLNKKLLQEDGGYQKRKSPVWLTGLNNYPL